MWRPKNWERRLNKIDAELMGYEKSRELVEAGADAILRAVIAWLLEYDTYSQYTGQDHDHLVRRLDIPNEDMEALTGVKY